MLFQVTNDLKVFLLFYLILIFCFSQYFSVLGMSNAEVRGEYQNMFMDKGYYDDPVIDAKEREKIRAGARI